MKRFVSMALAAATVAAVLAIALPAAQAKDGGAQAGGSGGRKIVVFRSGLSEAAKGAIVAHAGGRELKNLDLINAKAVWLPTGAAAKHLRSHRGVLRVDDDVVVEALRVKSSGSSSQPPEVLPWGVDRIDAELAWPTTTGTGIKVGIIDTGIDLRHPDLSANIKGGTNAIYPRKSPNDDNGHGTHVAGIVAASHNTIGVVGVGPQVNLYAIKVLNASGSGYLSNVIAGIQWAVTNGMQVINMSLGTSSDIGSFHDAVAAAKTARVVVVAAAGNSGGVVSYPGAYPEVIAVSATDQANTIAAWSSRGPQVDLAAPGVSVYSTYKGQSYATLSGTSMAAPHVAGAAALVLTQPMGTFDGNGNGKWDPDEVQAKLQSTATDLGTSGFDNLYGWGLVNVPGAIK